MLLGPRVIKTGISVCVALYICRLFALEPSIFAGVAAIFALQQSIYKTWRHLLDQIISNLIGAAIAIFSLHFLGNEPITIGLVMIIVIIICLKIKMKNTISLTLVTVLAIMSTAEDQSLGFALNRFFIIFIGIGVAFIINILVFPPKYKDQFMSVNHSAFTHLSLLIRTAISNELTESSFQKGMEELRKEITTLDELFQVFNEERSKMSKITPIDARELVVYRQMLRLLKQGVEVLEVIEEHFFQVDSSAENKKSFDDHLEFLIKIHEYFLLKLEGKAKQTPINDSFFILSSQFLARRLPKANIESEEELRLIVISSAIFEYAFQLNRFATILDRYHKIH